DDYPPAFAVVRFLPPPLPARAPGKRPTIRVTGLPRPAIPALASPARPIAARQPTSLGRLLGGGLPATRATPSLVRGHWPIRRHVLEGSEKRNACPLPSSTPS